jgi:DNA mismatch repair ATPase MutS
MPVRCLPTFSESGVDIRKGFHVNLLAIKNDIVPNSIQLTGGEKVLLLTGPNMGGKSTFLKQICTFAILAQMGSYVPAQSYSSIIYDQIFCRMGASDRIYEGKSTFYVELEETKRILAKATHRSMVVIDELGRGTSTFDGMAIAEAILDHLLEKVQCTTLYSTHYTQIAEKFRTNGKVKMMKMGYEPAEGGISFTYQLVEGVAEKSFACNVGRMVGIPEAILQRAERRSQKMHE